MNRRALEIAALHVRDAWKHHRNAFAALERYAATGCGLIYAKTNADLAREARAKALSALEAVTNSRG